MHSNVKKTLAIAAGTFAAAAATTLVANPASAENRVQAQDCKTGPETVVTHLVDRPDTGHGTDNEGVWALNKMDRKVTITKVAATQPAAAAKGADMWAYQAVVTDEGTFVTKAGQHLSPNKGDKLQGNVKGKVSGTFTVDFAAPKCFKGYEGNFNGETFTGTAPTGTSKWVPEVWGGEINVIADLGTNYKWTYTTCSEQWLTAYNNGDGQAPGAGDITGKGYAECSAPKPSASASAPAPAPSVAPSVAPGRGGGQPAPTTPAAAPSLPITGSKIPYIVGSAVALLGVGAGALFLSRRRRFTA